MADSWEDHAEEGKNAARPALNPTAKSFVFNPTASTWKPPPASAPAEEASIPAPPQRSQPPVPPALPVSPKAASVTAVTPHKAIGSPVKSPKKSAPMSSPRAINTHSSSKLGEKLKSIDLDSSEAEASAPIREQAPGQHSAPLEDALEESGEGAEDDVEASEEDPREHLNLVFIGHVDAGKSTLSGSVLYHTGAVDKRTIEKYEKDAKQLHRESWFLAFIMDTNEEERSKGITVEVGRAHLETENKRYTILDAPGHKNYVPNMISGAAQADVGVLVISARRGEFETGFEKGGQTREHAMLAKTLGVNKLIVVINKMDEKTVNWSQARFDECQKKLAPYLKSCGYAVKRDVTFLPISALVGANVKDRVSPSVCSWYSGPSFLELLDQISIAGRDPSAPVRIPVLDRYIDRGVCVMGKVEAGRIEVGKKMMIMPQSTTVTVSQIYISEKPVKTAKVGENVTLRVNGCSLEDIQKGFVLCDHAKPCHAVTSFKAQLFISELLEHRPIFSAGYKAVMHANTSAEECVVTKLLSETTKDKKTGEPKVQKNPTYVKQLSQVVCRIKTAQKICIERFEDMPQLGRFTLRDEGRTLAIGKILQIYTK